MSVLMCNYVFGQENGWNMINGDAQRTSHVDMDLTFPLEVLDVFDLGFEREQGLTVTDEYIFLMNSTDSSVLVTADILSGEVLWTYTVPGAGSSINFYPATAAGIVLAGGQGGEGLAALDVQTGEEKWFKPVGSLYTRCPIIYDNLVLQPCADSMVCFDIQTGEQKWVYRHRIPQISPVTDGETVYFGIRENTVLARDLRTGDSIWAAEVPNLTFASYTLDDEHLYMTHHPSQIFALDKNTGVIQWSFSMDSPGESLDDWATTLLQFEDYLVVKYYVGDFNRNNFLILDKQTGEEVRRYVGGEMNYGVPTIIGNMLVDYFGGTLEFYDILSGNLLHTMSIDDNGPTEQVLAANGKLYIGGSGPILHVLGNQTTSIKETGSAIGLRLFPNPVRDNINLQLDLKVSTGLRFDILSIDGRLIESCRDDYLQSGAHLKQIPVSGLAAGTYLLEVSTESVKTTRKFVKH